MPTVLRSGPHRLFFYSADRNQPRHVHVARDDCRAKIWLEPIQLHDSMGFGRAELGKLEGLVEKHAVVLRKAWDDFFAS
ncbi:MAG: DUF4160 domain-containing protein [Gemmatimonadetes bacterium]|nr:DUF4160 domain-containing protein [Gemmatimonadota bacterium]MBI2402271.1 DUF4160 domain-containing protein [Gemmatimonadota bacterium]MBI2537078.1 DUF4160 domain-containing protein [Gemmatimonadota bacterium]MBI2614854.1 DUF4160 domain-containing protein [Gemmatimonadota bacterium]